MTDRTDPSDRLRAFPRALLDAPTQTSARPVADAPTKIFLKTPTRAQTTLRAEARVKALPTPASPPVARGRTPAPSSPSAPHRALPLALAIAIVTFAVTALAAPREESSPVPAAKSDAPAAAPAPLRALVEGVVAEMAAACPLRSVSDGAAHDACRKALFGDSKFRKALKPIVLWGRAPNGNIDASLKDFRATQFGPDVFAGAYAPMWMVRGDFELEYDSKNATWRALVPAGFRNELAQGAYPYPFWHDAKKWTDYEDANTLVFWLDDKALKISQLTFTKRANKPPVAQTTRRHMPTFDGKWMWRDDKGQTQPAPTLFVGLYRPENPFLRTLDERYRSFALSMRDADCNACHVPNNPDKMQRLVLLQTPLHAASEIDRVIAAVKRNKMPLDDAGVPKDLPDGVRAKLLADAEAFAKAVRSAKAWEAQRRPKEARSAAPSAALQSKRADGP